MSVISARVLNLFELLVLELYRRCRSATHAKVHVHVCVRRRACFAWRHSMRRCGCWRYCKEEDADYVTCHTCIHTQHAPSARAPISLADEAIELAELGTLIGAEPQRARSSLLLLLLISQRRRPKAHGAAEWLTTLPSRR